MVAPIWAHASAIPCAPDATGAASLAAPQSKASAILGGAESALERMRREQASAAPAPVAAPSLPTTPAARATCLALPQQGIAASVTGMARPSVSVPFREDQFLSTRLLKIGKTPFDSQWRRVERARLSRGRVERLVGTQGQAGEDALSAVNRYVNQTIRYRDDGGAPGGGDYWQSAAETLRRGTGDCEDLAIAKYQMLRGIGFAADDLYVTLARDLARNVDHAVLVVRLGERHLMLDDATDTLVDAAEAHDYRAMFSYGSGRAFLHGVPARNRG